MSQRRPGLSALVLLALVAAPLAAQEPPADAPPASDVHITVKTGRGEATIETNDPNVEVVVTKGGRMVRIVDPQSKQTWEMDTEKCELRPLGQPGGLAVQLDGKAPLVLKREGKPLVAIAAGPPGSLPVDVGEYTCTPAPPLVADAVAALTRFLSMGVSTPSMGVFTPVPVPPWVTERIEEKYLCGNDSERMRLAGVPDEIIQAQEKHRADPDFRTPILPPIREGFPPPLCEEEPDDARILRALEPPSRGVPYLYAETRDNVQITKERLVDRIDPPRFFPLVGTAQLHHCHWKCTVNYDETIASEYPFPFQSTKPRVKVVYIDLDHLHLYPGPGPKAQPAVTRDLSDP